MHVHPLIAALRSDPASQRRSQAVMEDSIAAWRSGEQVAALESDLRSFGCGASLGDLPALETLMFDHKRAIGFADRFNQAVIAGLHREPLGEAPLRHTLRDGFSHLQLMQSGGATLSICAYEPVVDPRQPVSAQFADCEIFEIVVSGEARGEFYNLEPLGSGAVRIETTPMLLIAGDRVHRRARQDSRQLLTVTRSLLALQLSRVPKTPGPAYEYRLSDAALINQVSGDKKASEKMMALAVLGALGHRDGLGAMDAFATNSDHDLDARWEAVRQILAMDTQRGMDLLGRLASMKADALAQPASNLIQHLHTIEPALSHKQEEHA